jgi:hypothetical protein
VSIAATGGRVGIGTAAPDLNFKLDVVGAARFTSTLAVETLGTSGGTTLCRNASNQLADCMASSLRYKEQVRRFAPGLGLLNRLRPVSFTWKESGERDFGLIAEEVAAIEPLLVMRNAQGAVQGIKYDRLGVVLINALRQQQEQLRRQQERLDQQQLQLEGLKKLVCRDHPEAEVCR